MAQQNTPPTSPDKNTTGTNPTDRRTNETPYGSNTGNQPSKDGDRRGAEGVTMDRGNTLAVPNPGRDITTGGAGADGTNRNSPSPDSTTGSADTNSDATEDAAEVSDEKEEKTSS